MSNYQSATLFKVSILKATNRESVCSAVVGHVGIATIEVQEACKCTANRTTPIVAVGTYIVERTIGEVAAARHGQF